MGILVTSVFLGGKNGWPTSVCFKKNGGSCVDFWVPEFIGENDFVTWISKHLHSIYSNSTCISTCILDLDHKTSKSK